MDASGLQNQELTARFKGALKKSFMSKYDFCMLYLINLSDLNEWLTGKQFHKNAARAALDFLGENPDLYPIDPMYKINCEKYMKGEKCDSEVCRYEHSDEVRTAKMISEMRARAAKETRRVTFVDSDKWKWNVHVGTVIRFRSPHTYKESKYEKGQIRTEMACAGSRASAISFEAALLHTTLPLTVEFIIVSSEPFALELVQRLKMGNRLCSIGKAEAKKQE